MTQILTEIRRLKIEVWRMEEMVSPEKEKFAAARSIRLEMVTRWKVLGIFNL